MLHLPKQKMSKHNDGKSQDMIDGINFDDYFLKYLSLNVGTYVECHIDTRYFDIGKIMYLGMNAELFPQPMLIIGIQFVHKPMEFRTIYGNAIYQNKIIPRNVEIGSFTARHIRPLFKYQKKGYETIIIMKEIKSVIWSDKIEKKCYNLRVFSGEFFKKACCMNNINAVQHLLSLLNGEYNIKDLFTNNQDIVFGMKQCIKYKYIPLLMCVLDIIKTLNKNYDKKESILWSTYWKSFENDYHSNQEMLLLFIHYDHWSYALRFVLFLLCQYNET